VVELVNQILQRENFRQTSALVFATSIVITLLFWMILPTNFRINESTDYTGFYEPLARSVLEGRAFTHMDGTPATRYPPGYPLLLAGVFGLSHLLNISEAAILSGFILLCMGLESVLTFMLARTIWRPMLALVSSLVWITYPFALWLTKEPFSENPFIVVLYGGFYLFWYALLRRSSAWPTYFVSGLLMGCAMLIRPIAIGVGFVMAAIIWLLRRDISGRSRLFLMTMLLVGNFMAIFPWEAWIYSNTGNVVVLSSSGVIAIRDGLTFAVSGGFRRAGGLSADVMVLMKDLSGRGDEMESLQQIITVMTEQLRTRPLTVIKLFAIKSVLSWYGTDRRRFETYTMLIQIPYLVLILWGSWAAWKKGGLPKELTISIWLMVAYFWGVTLLVSPLLRYMTPVMGLLFVLIPGSFLSTTNRQDQPLQEGNSTARRLLSAR